MKGAKVHNGVARTMTENTLMWCERAYVLAAQYVLQYLRDIYRMCMLE